MDLAGGTVVCVRKAPKLEINIRLPVLHKNHTAVVRIFSAAAAGHEKAVFF